MNELYVKWNKNNVKKYKNDAERALDFALDMQISIWRNHYLNEELTKKDKEEDK